MDSVPLTFNIVSNNDRHEFETMIRTAFMLEDAMSGRTRFQTTANAALTIDDRRSGFFPGLRFQPGWTYFRPDENTVVCWTERIYAEIEGCAGAQRMELEIHAWAETYPLAQSVRDWFLGQAQAYRMAVTKTAFCLDWRFVGVDGTIDRAHTTEEAAEVLLDEAYPGLGGVETFVREYLAAPEPVLVLHGPPGTGKTRLIRALLSQLSSRKGEEANVLYTGDPQVLQRDAVFIEFVSGNHDAFLVEDADAFLLPRSEGNEMLHRFLNIADGIVRCQNRKIIFSTNLPGVKDIDPALLRSGRCFEHVYLPELDRNEVLHLSSKLSATPAEAQRTVEVLDGLRKETYSLAEVYSAHNRAAAPSGERRRIRRSRVPHRTVGFVG